MKCPTCQYKTRTLETRESDNNNEIRRRECLKCKHRFTTFEREDFYITTTTTTTTTTEIKLTVNPSSILD